jgi:CHAT domain-containing protein
LFSGVFPESTFINFDFFPVKNSHFSHLTRDEMVGLVRAFMYAGTPSVVASLWKVDDYYTEKLMVSFYRALKKSDKITALHLSRFLG